MKKDKVDLNLDDLRVESFEILPEIALSEMTKAAGAVSGSCYSVCSTGCETVVCYAPSGEGNSGGCYSVCSTGCETVVCYAPSGEQ